MTARRKTAAKAADKPAESSSVVYSLTDADIALLRMGGLAAMSHAVMLIGHGHATVAAVTCGETSAKAIARLLVREGKARDDGGEYRIQILDLGPLKPKPGEQTQGAGSRVLQ